LSWIEKNLAETRITKDGKTEAVKTGNLVYALFQHDTSRALDPQLHIHAILANLTKGPDGEWHALHADKIWANNTVIGAIYHAYLRNELEKLGYQLVATGKHGTFEIVGVPKDVLETFSQRREQILEKAAELGIVSPKGRDGVTVTTRDPKLNLEDRDGLVLDWMKDAAAAGWDGKALLEGAMNAAAKMEQRENAGAIGRSYNAIADAVKVARETVSGLMRSPDPLVDRGFVRMAHNALGMFPGLILDRRLHAAPGDEFLLRNDHENLEAALCLGGTARSEAQGDFRFFGFIDNHQIGAHSIVCLPPSARFCRACFKLKVCARSWLWHRRVVAVT